MTPMERTRRRSRRLQLKKALLKDVPTHQKSATVRFPEIQNNSSEVNSGSSKPDTAYSPVPLEDPKNQIRLLRFDSAVGCSPLALQTSVYNLDEAPPYVAISYAWGGHNKRTVVINGEPVRVRYNAYYALRQVQLHHRQIHIWIDTICINQNDDVEKSAQVSMMYQIFEGAAHVVSSLGAPFADAEWLFTVVRCLEPLLTRSRQTFWLEVALVGALLPTHEDPLTKRILAAIDAFDGNSYWKRMWVVQEVAAARNDVGLFSGPHQVSAEAVSKLTSGIALPWCWQKFYVNWGAANRLLWKMGSKWGGLGRNLSEFSGLHCSDPRDRLFALVGITDWQESGCPRIIPDYTKSVWDLALEVTSTSPLEVVRPLVRALEITPGTEEVAGLLLERRSYVSMQTMGGNQLDADRGSPTVLGRNFERSTCYRLRATASDSLYADISFDEFHYRQNDLHVPRQAADFIRRTDGSRGRIAHFVSGPCTGVAALVCPDARPDDILIQVKHFPGLLLVVRASKTDNMHYDIIGQGLLMEDHGFGKIEINLCPCFPCSCSPKSFARQSVFVVDVHVALTIEELIVLGAQHSSDKEEEPFIAAALDRMATIPTTRPRSAVSFTNFYCLWLHDKI